MFDVLDARYSSAIRSSTRQLFFAVVFITIITIVAFYWSNDFLPGHARVCLNALIWKHATTLLHYGIMTLLWRTGETNCVYISEHCNCNTWFRDIVIGICCHFKHFISHIVTTSLNEMESTGSYVNLPGEVYENLNTWGDYGVITLVKWCYENDQQADINQAHADMKNISCQNFSVLKNKYVSLILFINGGGMIITFNFSRFNQQLSLELKTPGQEYFLNVQ